MLNNILDWVTRMGDKAGFGGALVAGAGWLRLLSGPGGHWCQPWAGIP